MFLGLSTIPSNKDKGWPFLLRRELLGKMRKSRDWKNFLWSGHVTKNMRKLACAGLIYKDWGISAQGRDKEVFYDEGLLVLNPIHSSGCEGAGSTIPLSNLELFDNEGIY